MKNKDKYKEIVDKIEGFNKFCDSSQDCCDCMLCDLKGDAAGTMCIFHWLELEPGSSGELIMRLLQRLKNLDFTKLDFRSVADILSETRRGEIKAIWSKQDEEAKNEKCNNKKRSCRKSQA